MTTTAAPSLAERLGYKASDKLLIVNGDDTGMCHSANVATIEALEKGLMTSATIMVPCPWFSEIADYAKRNPAKDFGIHLCHTSEWKHYRWGPVASRTEVPGLIAEDGYMWREVQQVYARSNPQEAYIEAKAQIQKALAAGVDVTHLDSHMGTMQLDPKYLEKYIQLGLEFNVPLRMASQATFERHGFPNMRAELAAKGLVFPDYFVYEELKEESKGAKTFWMGILKNLKPGVTELYIHAGKPTEELKAITNSWRTRSEEFETFTNDPEVRNLVGDLDIKLIGFKPLRDLQRKKAPSPQP